MGRRNTDRSQQVDGILLLDKPAGMTSNQALQRVRRLIDAAKGGHTGALDPAATGMLPLCFGEATKVCAFLLDADKTYRVTAKLGIATETGDADGNEVARAEVPILSADEWQAVLDGFLGESMQIPPMYSALRKDGKRLYELARKGQTVEREPRPIRIDAIDLLEAVGSRLVFRLRCSKGTYVRSLVEDIAARVGTVALTASLHRETVGTFDPDDMLAMPDVEALAGKSPAELRARLAQADTALRNLPHCAISDREAERFRTGQAVSARGRVAHGLVRVYAERGDFLGVAELSETGTLMPRRVFLRASENP